MTTAVIIGRANVGKSTLFNRLAGNRQAMISNLAGTTRDLKYANIDWQGHEFELIDTGGFLATESTPLKKLTKKQQKKFACQAIDDIEQQVVKQAKHALTVSHLILFVVNAREGLNPQDKQIAAYLRQIKDKKIILAANKCDNQSIRHEIADFHRLGLGQPIPVSAVNGSGTGDLLDEIIKKIPSSNPTNPLNPINPIYVSIIGKPNVGKSSLLNKLINEDKAIVSSVPHTTREPNDSLIQYENQNIILTDTAGIRKKAKVEKKNLEQLGVSMSIASLKKSNITLLAIDISQPITSQDLQLGKLITQYSGGVIIVANKYDLLKKSNNDLTEYYKQYIYNHFPHLSWAPIVFTSAITGSNVQKILKLILDINQEQNINIPDSTLNRFLKSIIKKQPPPKKREGMGRKTKIKRAFITRFEQIGSNPPTFNCQINTQEKLPENYRQYIINQLRRQFKFEGVPIKLVVKSLKHGGIKT